MSCPCDFETSDAVSPLPGVIPLPSPGHLNKRTLESSSPPFPYRCFWVTFEVHFSPLLSKEKAILHVLGWACPAQPKDSLLGWSDPLEHCCRSWKTVPITSQMPLCEDTYHPVPHQRYLCLSSLSSPKSGNNSVLVFLGPLCAKGQCVAYRRCLSII